MSKIGKLKLSRDDVELLLPWYVSGKLSRDEADGVLRHLETDAGLREQLSAIKDDRFETIAVNEAISAPSSMAVDRLMDEIAEDEAKRPSRKVKRAAGGIFSWLEDNLLKMSPGRLGMAAAAVVGVMVLQAGLIGSFMLGPSQTKPVYEVAGGPDKKGVFLLVRFVPDASMDQIAKFLKANDAEIISGPEAGGVFKIRVSDDGRKDDTRAQIINQFRGESSLIATVLPSGS